LIKLGLTGGLGSGKTTAANFFIKKNAYVFDADEKSKSHLLQSDKLQNKLIACFGPEVQSADGRLDFTKLGESAFKDSISQKKLNSIIWPEVDILIHSSFKEALKSGYTLFVVDAALLIEADFMHFFDQILLITAPLKVRIERAQKRANISIEQISTRIKLQYTDEEKQKYSHQIINNDGPIESFIEKLELFYKGLNIK
jgi:dephospho-CoA kinase